MPPSAEMASAITGQCALGLRRTLLSGSRVGVPAASLRSGGHPVPGWELQHCSRNTGAQWVWHSEVPACLLTTCELHLPGDLGACGGWALVSLYRDRVHASLHVPLGICKHWHSPFTMTWWFMGALWDSEPESGLAGRAGGSPFSVQRTDAHMGGNPHLHQPPPSQCHRSHSP